jgi:hypothetical protein
MPNFVTSAVRAFIEQQFGGPTTDQDKVVICPASNVTTLLIEGNAERIELVITNFGSGNLSIAIDPTVLASGGLFLAPGGGTVSMNVRDDATTPSRRWWMSSGAGTSVYVLEVIRSIYTPPSELPGQTG